MSKHKHKHDDEKPPVPADTPETADAPGTPAEDTASDDGMPVTDESGVDVGNYADTDDGTEGETPFST